MKLGVPLLKLKTTCSPPPPTHTDPPNFFTVRATFAGLFVADEARCITITHTVQLFPKITHLIQKLCRSKAVYINCVSNSNKSSVLLTVTQLLIVLSTFF